MVKGRGSERAHEEGKRGHGVLVVVLGGWRGRVGLRINMRQGGKAAEESPRASRDGRLSVNGGAPAAAAKRLGGLGTFESRLIGILLCHVRVNYVLLLDLLSRDEQAMVGKRVLCDSCGGLGVSMACKRFLII